MPGKVPLPDLRATVFDRTGVDDDAVIQGPAPGEDAAAIDVSGGTLVVSSDPLSLAAENVGTLAVHVACNDVAAAGGDARWLTVVCLLPTDDRAALETIVHDLDAAATGLGVSVVGGHTEFVDALDRPLLSLTAIGQTDRFVPTGGARPGDRVVLAGGAGLEGTAILAADFGAEFEVDPETIERAETFVDEISIVPAASVLRDHATAMHDPTEGGVAAALFELASAAGVRLEIDREAIPVRPETATLCAAAGVDPLRIFGSGALLATVPAEGLEECLEACADAGIEAAAIGTVHPADDEPSVAFGDELLTGPVEDELYPLWEAADADS